MEAINQGTMKKITLPRRADLPGNICMYPIDRSINKVVTDLPLSAPWSECTCPFNSFIHPFTQVPSPRGVNGNKHEGVWSECICHDNLRRCRVATNYTKRWRSCASRFQVQDQRPGGSQPSQESVRMEKLGIATTSTYFVDITISGG